MSEPQTHDSSVSQKVGRTVRKTALALIALAIIFEVAVGGYDIQLSCSRTVVVTCPTDPLTNQPYTLCSFSFHGYSYQVNNGESLTIAGHQSLMGRLLGGSCSQEFIPQG